MAGIPLHSMEGPDDSFLTLRTSVLTGQRGRMDLVGVRRIPAGRVAAAVTALLRVRLGRSSRPKAGLEEPCGSLALAWSPRERRRGPG